MPVRRVALLLVAALGLAVPAAGLAAAAGPGSDHLTKVATLTAGTTEFTDTAIAAGTIAAVNRWIPGSPAYVFAEPKGGWRNESPAAELTPANGETGGALAATPDAVFAGEPQLVSGGAGAVDAFAKPAHGWSGPEPATATLTAPGAGPQLGTALAASGPVVVAVGGGAVYVFVKPAHGWSGTVHPAAKLVGRAGTSLSSVSISGGTVVAGASTPKGANSVYVFGRPRRGWAGTVRPVAELTPSDRGSLLPGGDNNFGDTVATSGATVAAGATAHNGGSRVYVFTRPRRGWRGTRHQQAELNGPELDAISGQTIAGNYLEQGGSGDQCPCDDSLWAVSPPPSGWSGTASPKPGGKTLSDFGATASLEGSTYVIPGASSVEVFRVTAATPARPPGRPHFTG